jgi:hypothetical protein
MDAAFGLWLFALSVGAGLLLAMARVVRSTICLITSSVSGLRFGGRVAFLSGP